VNFPAGRGAETGFYFTLGPEFTMPTPGSSAAYLTQALS
jgi:hypothetical protein